jgi:hypothetical protein
MPRTTDWICTAYGNSMFVSFDGNVTVNYASSPTGVTWTGRTITSAGYNSLGFGNGIFMAFADGSGVQTSTTGTSFTAATGTGLGGGSIIYSNGYYLNNWVSVLASSTSIAISSNNGSTWTAQTMSNSIYALTASPTRAVGVKNATTNTSYSTNLTTWTTGSMPVSSGWTGVAYGGGVFAAVSSTSGTTAASSTDGITWTARTMPATGTWFKVLWAGSNFAAFTQGGTTSATSPDGVTWTSRTITSPWWISGGVAPDRIVMVAYNASNATTISTS